MRRDVEVIGLLEHRAEAGITAETRRQEARLAPYRRVRVTKEREVEDRNAEQLQNRIVVYYHFQLGIRGLPRHLGLRKK